MQLGNLAETGTKLAHGGTAVSWFSVQAAWLPGLVGAGLFCRDREERGHFGLRLDGAFVSLPLGFSSPSFDACVPQPRVISMVNASELDAVRVWCRKRF